MAQNKKNGAFEPLRNFISQMDDLLTEKRRAGYYSPWMIFSKTKKCLQAFLLNGKKQKPII